MGASMLLLPNRRPSLSGSRSKDGKGRWQRSPGQVERELPSSEVAEGTGGGPIEGAPAEGRTGDRPRCLRAGLSPHSPPRRLAARSKKTGREGEKRARCSEASSAAAPAGELAPSPAPSGRKTAPAFTCLGGPAASRWFASRPPAPALQFGSRWGSALAFLNSETLPGGSVRLAETFVHLFKVAFPRGERKGLILGQVGRYLPEASFNLGRAENQLALRERGRHFLTESAEFATGSEIIQQLFALVGTNFSCNLTFSLYY